MEQMSDHQIDYQVDPIKMMRKPQDNSQAVAAFMAKKAEIDAMLIRLSDLSADHFDVSPDTLHWGHVGNLEYYASS